MAQTHALIRFEDETLEIVKRKDIQTKEKLINKNNYIVMWKGTKLIGTLLMLGSKTETADKLKFVSNVHPSSTQPSKPKPKHKPKSSTQSNTSIQSKAIKSTSRKRSHPDPDSEHSSQAIRSKSKKSLHRSSDSESESEPELQNNLIISETNNELDLVSYFNYFAL